MLVHIKDLVKDAQKKGYALGAFNIHNFETVLGVAKASIEAKSPVIIQVSEGTIKYMGIKPITHIVSTVAKNIATKVPIALHLDHGKSFTSVFECISAGFSSVHIDASHLPLDENIKLTKQVVALGKEKKVWVQGEVGSMVGGHGQTGKKIKIPKADLDEVIKFAKETKVNTIAVAIGTAHGVYENEDVDLDLLKKIKNSVKIPFVLHGGSGVDEKKLKKAIKLGVNIINIGTDIKNAFSETLIKVCVENKQERDPRKLLGPSIEEVKRVAVKQMELFGSANRIKITHIIT